MFRYLNQHHRNTERNGAEQGKMKGPCNIIQYSGALFFISVTWSGAERRWTKGPGNILQCSIKLFVISGTLSKAFRCAPLELGNVPMIEARSGAERGNNEYLEKLQCSSGVPIIVKSVRLRSVGTGKRTND